MNVFIVGMAVGTLPSGPVPQHHYIDDNANNSTATGDHHDEGVQLLYLVLVLAVVQPGPDSGACNEDQDSCQQPERQNVHESPNCFEPDLTEGVLVIWWVL